MVDEHDRRGDGETADQSGPEAHEERSGSHPTGAEGEPIPLGQKLYDSPFLLLAAGLLIMLVFFTTWGIWEVMSLPEAPLP